MLSRVPPRAPQDIDPSLPTHVLYGFFGVDETTFEVGKGDTPFAEDDLKQLRALKTANPDLKIQASIGGGGFTLDDPTTTHIFPLLMRSANGTAGASFTSSLISFARDNGLDGIDIDYEWPETPEEGELFTNLVRVVWDAFHTEARESGKPRLELSVVVTSNNKRRNYPLTELTKHIDFGMLMTYEFRGAWAGFTEGHSPVVDCDSAQNAGLSVSKAIDFMIKAGADPTKLLLGVASYGRTYTLATPQKNAPNNSPAISDAPGGPCT